MNNIIVSLKLFEPVIVVLFVLIFDGIDSFNSMEFILFMVIVLILIFMTLILKYIVVGVFIEFVYLVVFVDHYELVELEEHFFLSFDELEFAELADYELNP